MALLDPPVYPNILMFKVQLLTTMAAFPVGLATMTYVVHLLLGKALRAYNVYRVHAAMCGMAFLCLLCSAAFNATPLLAVLNARPDLCPAWVCTLFGMGRIVSFSCVVMFVSAMRVEGFLNKNLSTEVRIPMKSKRTISVSAL